MRRGVNGTDALETINAAASAIASGEIQGPQASVQKRRWRGCWSLYWCFKSNKTTRIGHAPESTSMGSDAPTAERPLQPPSIILPFAAPPSSPVSSLPSELPSTVQSPTGILSLTSVSANMYSPVGPASIFAIGPYAHETQLVSPPVFSTFTTEPSTAPYTPPPESVQLTTPSSPEVPFARLLEPNPPSGESDQRYPFMQYEFQSYQLQPGSPVSHLISPSSGISGSGTSTPFLDRELAATHPFFLEFRAGNPPKLLDLDKLLLHEWGSRLASGAVTPDAAGPRLSNTGVLYHQNSDVTPLPDTENSLQENETVDDRRVSFEITEEEVVRCVEKKPVTLPESSKESVEIVGHSQEEQPLDMTNGCHSPAGEIPSHTSEKDQSDGENGQSYHKNRTITLGSTKEFNFESVEAGNSDEPSIHSSKWWANEKKVVAEGEAAHKNEKSEWSFFPMMQTEVS